MKEENTNGYVPVPIVMLTLVAKGKLRPFDVVLWLYILSKQWRDPSTGKRSYCMKRAQDMADHFDVSVGYIRKRFRVLQDEKLLKIIYRARDLDSGKIMKTTNVEEINRLHAAGMVIKKHSFYRTTRPKRP